MEGLPTHIGLPKYERSNWGLFIDCSKRSLKCILPHNANEYVSVPIAHSVPMKAKYEDIRGALKSIKYDDQKWIICVDLKIKMVNFLLGQQ